MARDMSRNIPVVIHITRNTKIAVSTAHLAALREAAKRKVDAAKVALATKKAALLSAGGGRSSPPPNARQTHHIGKCPQPSTCRRSTEPGGGLNPC